MIGLPAETKISLAAGTTDIHLFEGRFSKLVNIFSCRADVRSKTSSFMKKGTVSRLSAVESTVRARS